MESIAATTTTADLYLTNCRLRAEIPMLAFTRLSDVLNNIPGMFLHGALLEIGDSSSGAPIAEEGLERTFVVRLQDVLFVFPLAKDASGTPSLSAERRARLQQR